MYYNFIKNYTRELTYDNIESEYVFNIAWSATNVMPTKTGVTYCYKLDFTNLETKGITRLQFNTHEDYDTEVSKVQVYNETNQIPESEFDPDIDEINETGSIDLSELSLNYDCLYVYVTYDVEHTEYGGNIPFRPIVKNSDLNSGTSVKPGKLVDDETTYNFTYNHQIVGAVKNPDKGTIHRYDNYLFSDSNLIEDDTFTYTLDLSELEGLEKEDRGFDCFYLLREGWRKYWDELYSNEYDVEATIKTDNQNLTLDVSKYTGYFYINLNDVGGYLPTEGTLTIKVTLNEEEDDYFSLYSYNHWNRIQ